MARRIAASFDSEELHVFWTAHPGSAPAEVEELPIFGMAVAAISAFFESLTTTLINLGRTAARS